VTDQERAERVLAVLGVMVLAAYHERALTAIAAEFAAARLEEARRLRAALERVREVLHLYDRSALDGDNILDDGVESAGYIIDEALGRTRPAG
jgi:O-phosphoseryl-tRNA(Cys) synthetase